MIDMHQIMLISLFPTPFDHYHLHGSGGLILWYDLRLRRNNADDGNDDNGIFYDNEKTKTHPNDMTLKSKYTNFSDYFLVKRGLTSRQNISTSDFMNLA